MEPLYNIYFAGEVLEGHRADQVRARLGALFKANEATLGKLFSGRAQLVKGECDRATALKYKQAMERAGARPLIKRAAARADDPVPARAMTAAERIAALAAAPDQGGFSREQPCGTPADDTADFGLDPAGADVLRPEERAESVVADIDTSALSAEEPGERLSAEPAAAPPAPDTGHLSMGAVGEDIPTLAADVEPLSPDTGALDLSPQGTDFSDCARPEAEAPALDLSAIELAPEGSAVLEPQYRKRPAPPPPDSGNIELEG